MCLAQGHNTAIRVGLEPPDLLIRTEVLTTRPRALLIAFPILLIVDGDNILKFHLVSSYRMYPHSFLYKHAPRRVPKMISLYSAYPTLWVRRNTGTQQNTGTH